jgi:hypothetical protein
MRPSSPLVFVLTPLGLFTLLTLIAAFAALSGCHAEREPDTGVFVGPAPRLPFGGTGESSDAGPDGRAGAMISGHLETDDGIPIIGRPLAVVDARGERREVLTDEGGGFNVPDVVRPYDLAIAGSPSSATPTPTVFLGITREDPFVEVFERDGPKTRPAAEILRFGVKPPPCTSTTSSCVLSVVSGSASGSGASSISYREGKNVPFEIEHEWHGDLVGAKETITLHVLAFDEARTTFAHASLDGIRAASGDLVELGILEPIAVPATAPVDVSAVARGPAAAWSPSIATWVDLPGGAPLAFSYGMERQETLRLPLIHGATFRANAWMQHPAVADRPQFHSAVQAWSGMLPIEPDGGAVSLAVPLAPAPVRPEMDGHLSAGGLGLAWTNPSSAPMPLTEITVARVDTGVLRYRVWTIGDEVPFAKLETLGIQPLQPGDHVIGITSSPVDVLDDIVHPDGAVRRARYDVRRRGATSYQRFRFQVTP